MKVLDHKILSQFTKTKVQFIRIDPEDLTSTLNEILVKLMNLSWLSNFDKEFEKVAMQSRASKTIRDIADKFTKCNDDKITKDAGEYVVSELARQVIVKKLDYLDIPLGELLGKKKSGNPGFDFHSQNKITDIVIFGESKYVANTTAYSSALPQIKDFIECGKDIEDIPQLTHFCTDDALTNVIDGKKGFSAAFSAKSTSSDLIIKNIIKREDFKFLLNYEEVILVAVNI